MSGRTSSRSSLSRAGASSGSGISWVVRASFVPSRISRQSPRWVSPSIILLLSLQAVVKPRGALDEMNRSHCRCLPHRSPIHLTDGIGPLLPQDIPVPTILYIVHEGGCASYRCRRWQPIHGATPVAHAHRLGGGHAARGHRRGRFPLESPSIKSVSDFRVPGCKPAIRAYIYCNTIRPGPIILTLGTPRACLYFVQRDMHPTATGRSARRSSERGKCPASRPDYCPPTGEERIHALRRRRRCQIQC